jgi:endonuclease-3 related protein
MLAVRASSITAIHAYYRALLKAWGTQDWWPAHTRFEVVVGAYLTQNTAWTNVERALANLRAAGRLSVAGIRKTSLRQLQQLVRPSGYFRQKAQRLKNFVAYLDRRNRGSLRRMFTRPTQELRRELLELDGVGPETADSILLYAGGHASFVVDAYTHRVLHRHGLLPRKPDYEATRALVEEALHDEPPPRTARSSRARRHKFTLAGTQPAARVYNEYHALFVELGKRHCLKAEAKCSGCPLEPFLPAGGPRR